MSTPSPYAARQWQQHYDYWVRPQMTYPGRPLGDILALTAVHRPDKRATHFLGAELTFLDLKRRSDALAASLAGLGIAKGDRVAIMLPNCPQYIIAAFAILRLGAVVVNINPSYTARELLVVATDSAPRVLITLDALAPLVQAVRAQTTIEQIIVTSLAEYSAAAAPPPRIDGTLPFSDLIATRLGSGADQVANRSSAGADQIASRSSAGANQVVSRSSAGADQVASGSNAGADHVASRSSAGANQVASGSSAGADQVASRSSASADQVASRSSAGVDQVASRSSADAGQVPIGPDDLAVLQYTGGTTGTPKGAMLTHGNIFANVVQTVGWTNPMYVFSGDERYLVVIPYFHIYAFSVCMMTGLWMGALQIIHPKYDPDQVLASIKQFRPTYFPAVPTVFVSLLNHPRVGEFGLEHVRHFNSGGAPCPVEVMEEFERRIGRPLTEGYGLSETSPVTHSTPQLARRKPGTIGVPFPDTDMKVVDADTGTRDMPLGEAGELCISGPQVMKGYWNKPEESAQVLRADRAGRIWFHTGDIAVVDEDGYTSIVQRKKDMIIVDGFNVYPSEVEAVLYSHPAVRLAAVIGIPDPYHGETVRACIAFKPGATATADDIIAFCRVSLAEYKVPCSVDIRDTLPMSAVGKILYRVLRAEHAASVTETS